MNFNRGFVRTSAVTKQVLIFSKIEDVQNFHVFRVFSLFLNFTFTIFESGIEMNYEKFSFFFLQPQFLQKSGFRNQTFLRKYWYDFDFKNHIFQNPRVQRRGKDAWRTPDTEGCGREFHFLRRVIITFIFIFFCARDFGIYFLVNFFAWTSAWKAYCWGLNKLNYSNSTIVSFCFWTNVTWSIDLKEGIKGGSRKGSIQISIIDLKVFFI
jgi:hypothetical protein